MVLLDLLTLFTSATPLLPNPQSSENVSVSTCWFHLSVLGNLIESVIRLGTLYVLTLSKLTSLYYIHRYLETIPVVELGNLLEYSTLQCY
jgi:hypothetical protein